eukprot:403376111
MKLYVFYKDRVKQVVADGYNYILMTFGESQSGKSYSMIGDNWDTSIKNQVQNLKLQLQGKQIDENVLSESHGMIPRSIQDIFQAVSDKELENPDIKCKVFCSSILLYCEQFYDLLQEQASQDCQLELKELDGQVFLKGLTEYHVQNSIECFALLKRSLKSIDKRNQISEGQNVKQLSTFIFNFEIEVSNTKHQTVQRSNIVCCARQDAEGLDSTINTLKFAKNCRKVNQNPKVNLSLIKSQVLLRSPTKMFSYMNEIIKVKKNKGLQLQEKIELIENQMKQLKQQKAKLKNNLQNIDQYEQLKQEDKTIQKELDKLYYKLGDQQLSSKFESKYLSNNSFAIQDPSKLMQRKNSDMLKLPQIRKSSQESTPIQGILKNNRYQSIESNQDKFKHEEKNFQLKLIHHFRCPKCTLYLPCSHFERIEEAENYVKQVELLKNLQNASPIVKQFIDPKNEQQQPYINLSSPNLIQTKNSMRKQISLSELHVNSNIDTPKMKQTNLIALPDRTNTNPIYNSLSIPQTTTNHQGIYAKNKALSGKYFGQELISSSLNLNTIDVLDVEDKVVIRIRGRNNDFIESMGSLTRSFQQTHNQDQKIGKLKEIQQRISYLDQIERTRQDILNSKLQAIEDKRKQRQIDEDEQKMKQKRYKQFLENQSLRSINKQTTLSISNTNQTSYEDKSAISQGVGTSRKHRMVRDLIKKNRFNAGLNSMNEGNSGGSTNGGHSSVTNSLRIRVNRNVYSNTNRTSAMDFSQQSSKIKTPINFANKKNMQDGNNRKINLLQYSNEYDML